MKKALWVVAISAFVFTAVLGVQLLLGLIISPFISADVMAIPAVSVLFSIVSYGLALLMVIYLPPKIFKKKLAKSSPVTGDVFASAFTGALINGHSMKKSAAIAADFVVECLKETEKHPGHSYGPVFEPVLGKLIEMIKNNI